MMRPTPSSVSASLSLVWDAGNSERFSSRLSRINACGSLAMPCTTLMRSNTTRRSAPITRSRLRKPTSKSTTTTFCPACASAAPIAAVEVVLPTPPLPDVTTSTLAISYLLYMLIERRNPHDVAFKPSLRRPIAQRLVQFFRGLVETIDGQKLGLDLLAVDPRRRIAVDARHRAAAQRSVNVDGPAGDDLGARADRPQHRHVAVGKHDRLARADRTVDCQRCRNLEFRLFRLGLLDRAVSSAGQQRRHAGSEPRGFDALDPEDADVAFFEAEDEMGDRRPAQIHRGQIEHHGLSNEEARRAGKRRVDLGQPLDDRHGGRKNECNVGAAS